jgi:hypothetical protein
MYVPCFMGQVSYQDLYGTALNDGMHVPLIMGHVWGKVLGAA